MQSKQMNLQVKSKLIRGYKGNKRDVESHHKDITYGALDNMYL